MRKTTFFILAVLLRMIWGGGAAAAETVSPNSLTGCDISAVADTTSRHAEPKGKYIFVPDSLENDVIRLLMGGSKVIDDENALSADEKTIWKGDTISMILKQKNFGRYDRGLSNYLFIPKGGWTFGLTASYGEFDTDDMDMLGLLTDIDINIHAFSIKPYLAYFIKSNLSAGLRFGYMSAKGSIGSFNVDIDEDMNFNLHDVMYRNESYTAAFTLSQYIGIGRKSRFGVYHEVELAFSSGNSDFSRPYAGEPRNTHTTYMEAALNFSPGVCVMIMKNVSFNVSFGVFGFHLRNEKQTEQGVSTGNRMTSGADFRFNIFNINFGIAVHI